MIHAHPPLARLLPRSPSQRAHATAHALIEWTHTAACHLAHAIALVVPVLVLAGIVFALAITVAGPARRQAHPLLLAPREAPAGICTRPDGVATPSWRDACWGAFFDRISRDPAPGSPSATAPAR